MTVQALSSQDLIRRAVTEVVNLPETDLLVVLEVVADLKSKQAQTKAERHAQAAEIVARARKRAIELKSVPREELFAQFRDAMESIRAEAIARGTAIQGDWEGD